MTLTLQTAPEIAQGLARRARRLRLARGLTQQGLADRAGMSLSSLRRFERSGEVAFLSLVRIAIALGVVDELTALFAERPTSLDDLVREPRQRGWRQ